MFACTGLARICAAATLFPVPSQPHSFFQPTAETYPKKRYTIVPDIKAVKHGHKCPTELRFKHREALAWATTTSTAPFVTPTCYAVVAACAMPPTSPPASVTRTSKGRAVSFVPPAGTASTATRIAFVPVGIATTSQVLCLIMCAGLCLQNTIERFEGIAPSVPCSFNNFVNK